MGQEPRVATSPTADILRIRGLMMLHARHCRSYRPEFTPKNSGPHSDVTVGYRTRRNDCGLLAIGVVVTKIYRQ